MKNPPARYVTIAFLLTVFVIMAVSGMAHAMQAASSDTTPPTITYTRSPAPNSNGWNNCPVTVRFTATDTGSGINGLATYTRIVAADGYDQSVTWSVSDRAGNTQRMTVSGINIDTYAPTVVSAGPAAVATDVPVDAPITITFSECVDRASALAGVSLWDENSKVAGTVTYDNVDTVSFVHGALAGGKTYTVTVDGVTDLADNPMDVPYTWAFTTAQSIESLDTTPPTITYTRSPAPNSNGWNNGPVTVTFTASDAESGLATAGSYTRVFNGDGAGQSVSWSATDNEGNTMTATVDNINIDTVAPVISGVPATAANSNGWYKNNVVVHFTATDTGGSGIASVTPDITLTSEGAMQSATGSATDLAGNTAQVTVGGINIDKTAPTITSTVPAGGAAAVDASTLISATFSEKVDVASAIAGLTLWDGNTRLPGTVTCDSASKVATLAHAALSGGRTYTVRVDGVKDLAGNPMSATYTWSFSTIAAKVPARNAVIVSSNIPDSMGAGQCKVISVTVKNTGTVAWSTRDGYALTGPGNAGGFGTRTVPISCDTVIKPGKQYTFCFTIVAPAQAGTCHLQYQMAYKGARFGETLTKDVQVTGGTYSAEFCKSLTVPALKPGQTYMLKVTVKNTGDQTWTYKLNQVRLNGLDDAAKFGFSRACLQCPVKPGCSYTFNIRLKAPSQPGTYKVSFQLGNDDSAFGPVFTTDVTVSQGKSDDGNKCKEKYYYWINREEKYAC